MLIIEFGSWENLTDIYGDPYAMEGHSCGFRCLFTTGGLPVWVANRLDRARESSVKSFKKLV